MVAALTSVPSVRKYREYTKACLLEYNGGMLVTLFGADSYNRLARLNELTAAYLKKHGNLAHERFSLSEEDGFDSFREFMGSQSIFDTKKLVILDEPFEYSKTKELKETLKRYIDSKDQIIIINSTKKYPPPYKFLTESPSKVEEFKAPEGKDLVSFIRSEAKNRGIELSAGQIEAIANTFGKDTWRISTELDQFELLKSVSTDSYQPEIAYFGVLNQLKGGYSPKDRLPALEKILTVRRDDAARVFNSLAYRLRSADEAKMYADYDLAVKAGRLEYEEVLLAVALGLRFNPLT